VFSLVKCFNDRFSSGEHLGCPESIIRRLLEVSGF
jgi:hypothetical protein